MAGVGQIGFVSLFLAVGLVDWGRGLGSFRIMGASRRAGTVPVRVNSE